MQRATLKRLKTLSEVLAENVRALRGGTSREALAHRSGVSARTIASIEHAETPATLATLEALAGAFGVTVGALLAREKPMSTPSIADVLELLSRALDSEPKRKLLAAIASTPLSNDEAEALLASIQGLSRTAGDPPSVRVPVSAEAEKKGK
jgi:transcriptional regulator with XRE-family HTH domain